MNHGIGKTVYFGVNQAYSNHMASFKLRGTLVSKNGQDIKLDVGNSKILDINLRKELNAKLGDTVVIDKKEILHSRVSDPTVKPLMGEEEGKYSRLLKSFNLPFQDEYMQALKTLDLHGIHLSKDNLMNFITLKGQLNQIVEGLDYDTALQIVEKDVDLEKEPLEKVAQAVEEVKQEEGHFSLSKLIGSLRGLSTEEAENISQKIYGSKMGKDIIDIIKALNRAGMEISKKNISRINDAFSKLHQVKDMSDEGVIEAIKGKMEASLDHLYRIKHSVKKGAIAVEEKIGQAVSKAYNQFLSRNSSVSSKDLRLLEEDIRELLTREGLENTPERIQLAKEMIKGGTALTKEHFDKIEALKNQLQDLAKLMNHEKIAQLMGKDIDVEKTSISQLLAYIKSLDLEQATNPELTKVKAELEKIEEILKQLQQTGEIKDKDLLLLLNRKKDFKLGDVQRIIVGEQQISTDISFGATVKMVGILNDVKHINYNSVAYQLNQSAPINLENLALANNYFLDNREIPLPSLSSNQIQEMGLSIDNQKHMEVAKALIVNEMTLSKGNVQRILDIVGRVQFAKNNLTSQMVTSSVKDGLELEKLELEKLSSYIHQKQQSSSTHSIISKLPQMNQEGNNLMAMLIKNGMTPNLKELQRLSLFINNQDQIGHQLKDILELLEKEGKDQFTSELASLKEAVKTVSQGLRDGKVNLKDFQEQLAKDVGKLSSKLETMEGRLKEELSKGISRLGETIETQNNLNNKDTTLQLPMLLDNQIKNLQIYIMNEKKSGKKIDPNKMSILLNMETNRLGNVNVYVGVWQKQVTLKVGVQLQDYKRSIEEQAPQINELMKKIGYEVKELSYKVDEEGNLMDMIDMIEEQQRENRHFIDITI